MAEAISYMMNPGENQRAFNTRIRNTCETQPVTDVQLDIVDGLPFVTLQVEFREATEEDVNDGLASEVGEEIPDGELLMCAICQLGAKDPKDADKTERYMEKIYTEAAGTVIEVLVYNATTHRWVEMTDEIKKKFNQAKKKPADKDQAQALEDIPIYAEVDISWALVVWLAEAPADDDEDEDLASEPEAPEADDDTADEEPEEEPKTKAKTGKGSKTKSNKGSKSKKPEDKQD